MSWKDKKAVQVVTRRMRMTLLQCLQPTCVFLLVQDLRANRHLTDDESNEIENKSTNSAKVKTLIEHLVSRMTSKLFMDFVDAIGNPEICNHEPLKCDLLSAYNESLESSDGEHVEQRSSTECETFYDKAAISVVKSDMRMDLLKNVLLHPECSFLVEYLLSKSYLTDSEAEEVYNRDSNSAKMKTLIDRLATRMTTKLFMDFVDAIGDVDICNQEPLKCELVSAYETRKQRLVPDEKLRSISEVTSGSCDQLATAAALSEQHRAHSEPSLYDPTAALPSPADQTHNSLQRCATRREDETNDIHGDYKVAFSSLLHRTLPSRWKNCVKPNLSSVDLMCPIKPIGKIRSKLVAVGDQFCGKTTLLTAYSKGPDFDVDAFFSTVFEESVADIIVDGVEIELALWDTAGAADYERLRPLSYPYTNVFLIVYSVDHSESLLRVRKTFVPEIRRSCPKVPFILVATRPLDMDSAAHCISRAEGEALALEIRASAFFDVDFKNYDSMKAVFEEAARLSVLERVAQRKKSKKCRVQ